MYFWETITSDTGSLLPKLSSDGGQQRYPSTYEKGVKPGSTQTPEHVCTGSVKFSLTPPTFSGGKDCVITFVSKVKKFAAFYRLSEEDKCLLLPCLLDDEALRFWDFEVEGKSLSFGEMERVLLDHFGDLPNDSYYASVRSLENLVSAKYDSTMDNLNGYYDKIRKECGKLKESETVAIKWFLEGLCDDRMKLFLITKHPESLSQVLALAKEFEAVESAGDGVTTPSDAIAPRERSCSIAISEREEPSLQGFVGAVAVGRQVEAERKFVPRWKFRCHRRNRFVPRRRFVPRHRFVPRSITGVGSAFRSVREMEDDIRTLHRELTLFEIKGYFGCHHDVW